MIIVLFLVIINAAGFLLMRLDKEKAKKHQWRIPEATLWTVALLGGSIGSLIGMHCFRHKTRHIQFTLGMPVLVTVHLVVLLLFTLNQI